MSEVYINRPSIGSICSGCGHDLTTGDIETDKEGKEVCRVYCTNARCKFRRVPHPTSWWVNSPGMRKRLSPP